MPTFAGTGSAGTMVAAVLESVGYQYQAYILDEMGGVFTGKLGGLIYLVGVVVTVFSVAIRGGYKFAPWLLIGPPLFFSAVVPRSEVNSSLWRFGGQARDQARADEELEKMTGANTANVSTLFARYNHIVSNTVEEFVKIINNNKLDSDKLFILQGQMLSRLYSRTVDSNTLHTFLSNELFQKCAESISAAKIVNDPFYTPTDVAAAKKKLSESFTKDLDWKTLAPTSQKFVEEMNAKLAADGSVGKPPGDNWTCAEIWHYAYLGLIDHGERNVRRIEEDLTLNGIDPKEGVTQLARADGLVSSDTITAGAQAELVNRLVRVSAKYLLRNEAARVGFAGRIEELANLQREYNRAEAPIENELAQTEYGRARSTEYSEKTRLMMAASNLPYYQGLLLYFLAIAFPFFALLLLVPGKHAGFILWFLLWLWVKSWDIGFAIVMQLDSIIFTMMSMGKEVRPAIQNGELSQTFDVAMYALRVSDPTFQMTTYYNVIATCLSAIPIVTSQLILGSLSGGAGLVSQGMKMNAESSSSGHARAHSQLAVANMRHQHQENAMIQSTNMMRNFAGYNIPKLAEGTSGRMINPPSPRVRAVDSTLWLARQHVDYGPPTIGPGGKVSGESNRRYFSSPRTPKQDAQQLMGMKAIAGIFNGISSDVSGNGALTPISGKSAFGSSGWKVGQGLAGAASGGLGKIAEKLGGYLESEGDIQLDNLGKWALFDATYSEENRRLAAMARIYGMLEVPWSENSPEVDEADADLKFHRMEADLKAEIGKAFGEMISGGINAGLRAF